MTFLQGTLPIAIPIVGVSALGSHGDGYRGLSSAKATHEEAPIQAPADKKEKRARMLMSRGALLAAQATADVLKDAGWSEACGITQKLGFFLGVGASGGSMTQLNAMIDQSLEDGEFSLARFGDRGLRACNPLFAFQLMNNFTLCHSAILQQIQGPNACFFSRGAGTHHALSEAAWAIIEDECPRAIAGGADTALHPVTRAELQQGGFIERGMRPSEGAALLALSAPHEATEQIGFLERVAVYTLVDLETYVREALDDGPGIIVLAPWGPPARKALNEALGPQPDILRFDLTEVFGASLAATPALAWAFALDAVAGTDKRALVVTTGIDDALGLVSLRGAL